ncbi:acid-sensing ion channel 1, partial [Elysia marginata]
TTLKTGPLNGLRLELNIQADEYLPSSNVGGIKVLIHDNKEYPFPEDGSLVVAPGFYTAISVRKMKTKRLSSPYGNCIDSAVNTTKNLFSEGGFIYSRNGCQKSCFQEYVYRTCSCCDSGFPCVGAALEKATGKRVPGGVRWCNSTLATDLNCMENANFLFTENKLGCSDRCPPACEQSTFKTSVSTAKIPTRASFDTTVEHIKYNGKAGNISDFNAFLTNSYILLEIYYETFNVEMVVSEPAYTWSKVLGDIGGQLGLFLGFSLLTALEILEFVFADLLWGVGIVSLCRNSD